MNIDDKILQEQQKRIFAEKLNYYMTLNHKQQDDIVNDLGINKSTISTWCRGTKMPRVNAIQALADYFNIGISDLIEENATKPTDNDRLNEFIELCSQLNDDELDIIETLIDSLLSKRNKSKN